MPSSRWAQKRGHCLYGCVLRIDLVRMIVMCKLKILHLNAMYSKVHLEVEIQCSKSWSSKHGPQFLFFSWSSCGYLSLKLLWYQCHVLAIDLRGWVSVSCCVH